MVHYVRFFKTPRIQYRPQGGGSVTALITITTDLGDSFLAQDVELQALVADSRTNLVIHNHQFCWKAGCREFALSIPVPTKDAARSMILGIGVRRSNSHDLQKGDVITLDAALPVVISGWSAPFGGPNKLIAAPLIERRLDHQSGTLLTIWEETGNNIAQHVWDAALAALICLKRATTMQFQRSSTLEKKVQTEMERPSLNVLELGAGCGIFGIALAQMRRQTTTILTDLPEAEEIITRNISRAHLAEGSHVYFKVLDWDDGRLDIIANKQPIDLILVSDCTYNADSLPSLVRVLDRLVKWSPKAVILISLKRRHESETVFFDLMGRAELSIAEQNVIQLPSAYSQEGEAGDPIELYIFHRTNDS